MLVGGEAVEHLLIWLSIPADHLISMVLTGHSHYCCFSYPCQGSTIGLVSIIFIEMYLYIYIYILWRQL